MTVTQEKIEREKKPASGFRPLLIVNDDTCSLRFLDPPHSMESISRPITPMQGTQVGALTWSLASEVAYSWPSHKFESYYDKFSGTVSDEQVNESAEADPFRPMHRENDAILAFHTKGVDYLPVLIERTRKAGLKFYGSFRMNDIHHRSYPDGPLSSAFWRTHQHFRLWDVTDARTYYNGALDYSFPEVRQRRLGMIQEVVDNYDVDGVELDFCREPYTFPPAEAWQKRHLLTEFVQNVRQVLDAAGQRRGKRLDLLMRVPLDANKLRNAGMDVNAWIESSLIDVLIMSSLLNDYNAVIEPWLSKCRDYQIPFYPSLEWNPAHNARHNHMTVETIDEVIRRQRAAAQNFLSQGAEGIYVFNYPCLLYQVKRSADEFAALAQVFSELGRADTLKGKPKQYTFWSDLPMQLESARPPQFHQTIRFNVNDPDLAESTTSVSLSFRQATENNPHVSHYYLKEQYSILPAGWVTYLLNGKPVPAEWITREAQPAGAIVSGFELPVHEKIIITPPASAMKQGENKLAFHIDRFPDEQDPYVHIYELLVDVNGR